VNDSDKLTDERVASLRWPSLEFSAPMRKVSHVEFARTIVFQSRQPIFFEIGPSLAKHPEPSRRNNVRSGFKAVRVVTPAIV
jgi:hypothetical protein